MKVEAHDVLICYRRQDVEFVREFSGELQRRFGVRCFRDEEAHKPGYQWRAYWKQQLGVEASPDIAPGLGPTVVVIAAASAAQDAGLEGGLRRPDIVVEEIWDSLQPPEGISNIPIVILQFGTEGWSVLEARLREKFSEQGVIDQFDSRNPARQWHQPPPFDPDWVRPDLPASAWDAILKPVVTSVRAYFFRRLSKERENTQRWADEILDRQFTGRGDDFSKWQRSRVVLDEAIQSLATEPEKRVLLAVAQGGMGKTTQVARSVRKLLQSEHGRLFFPIILSSGDMGDIGSALRDKLGLNWISRGLPISLPDEGLLWLRDQLCFVVDGLEQASDLPKAARMLDQLRGPAKLIVTSRPGAWSFVRGEFAVDDADIVVLEEIDDIGVAKTLGVENVDQVSKRPYLRNPVFLDVARFLMQNRVVSLEIGIESETALLDALRNFSVEPATGMPNDEERELNRDFLQLLARLQIDAGSFSVSLSLIDHELFQSSIDYLISKRHFAIIDGRGQDRTIRLRHDLVDAHNLAHMLRSAPSLEGKMLTALRLGFGQVAFEGIVQFAHDKKFDDPRSSGFLTRFFEEFLRVVDNKEDGPLKAAGWNGTYVVRSKVHAFLDHIRTVMTGQFLGKQTPPNSQERLSSLSPARITQFALSSVASTLAGARSLSIADSEGVFLASLRTLIATVSERGRLIEALAKIDRVEDALEIIDEFAGDADFVRKDRGVAKYLANSLAEIARASPVNAGRIQGTISVLESYFEAGEVAASPVILRWIERAKAEVAYARGDAPPAARQFSVEEIEEGLRNGDLDNPRNFSDWTTVEYYLGLLRKNNGKIAGAMHERAVMAIGRSLWHQHLRCYEKAARTLGFIDHPMARGLLLHVLTFESDDAPETQIIEALRAQIAFLMKKPSDMRYRFKLGLIRSMAVRNRNVGYQRAEELCALAAAIDGASDAIVTEGFVELRRFESIPALVPSGAAETELPDWLTAIESSLDVGAELEEKIAFSLRQDDADGEVGCLPSSWCKPRRLHLALMHRQAFFRNLYAQRGKIYLPRPPWNIWMERDSSEFNQHLEAIAKLYAAFEQSQSVPSIAVVHAILVLADENVIETKRAAASDYTPSAWSISFEEQLKREDLRSDRALVACLLRGIREEFGVELAEDDVFVRGGSFGVEWPIGNLAFLIYATVRLTAGEFKSRSSKALSDGELDDFTTKPVDSVTDLVVKDEAGYWTDPGHADWHGTNGARLALVRITEFANRSG